MARPRTPVAPTEGRHTVQTVLSDQLYNALLALMTDTTKAHGAPASLSAVVRDLLLSHPTIMPRLTTAPETRDAAQPGPPAQTLTA